MLKTCLYLYSDNNNEVIILTLLIMTNSILNIANQVVNQMTTSSFKDADMLNCVIFGVICNENISFENETSYNMFKSFLTKQILDLDEKLYRAIYPLYEYK
jgi:hypothetical protein